MYSDESSQDIKRVAKVLNIDFVNENSSSLSNIQDYFLANRVPSLAIVTLKVAFFDWADKNYKTEIKKIIVRFENVKIRSENGEMRNINFKITSYQAICIDLFNYLLTKDAVFMIPFVIDVPIKNAKMPYEFACFI